MINSKDILSTITITIFLIAITYLASLLAPVPFTLRRFSGDFYFTREYRTTIITSVSDAKYFLKGYEDVFFFPGLPALSGSSLPFDRALMEYTDDFFEENIIIVLTLGGQWWSYLIKGINYAGTISIYRHKLGYLLSPVDGEWTTVLLMELDRSMLSTNFRTRFIEIDHEKRRELLLEMNN